MIDIETARNENWRRELDEIKKTYDTAIRGHIRVVKLKTGHMIRERTEQNGKIHE